MQTRRVNPSAGCREALPAGTIASRNGSANEAPVPRRKVRRERCFPVMKFIFHLPQFAVVWACLIRKGSLFTTPMINDDIL